MRESPAITQSQQTQQQAAQNPKPAPPRARTLRHRAPLLWLLLPLMAGLIAAKTSPVPLPIGVLLFTALPLALVALITASRHTLGLIALVLATALAGAASYEITRARLSDWEKLPPREALFTLKITHTFTPKNNRINGLARVTHAQPHLRDLIGQPLYFSLTPSAKTNIPPTDLIRSAEIETIGVLERLPRKAASDTFDGFLSSSGMNFKLTRGKILGLAATPTATANFYERTRLRFSKILTLGLEKREKQAGVLRAMVLGQKQDIDETQKNIFLGSGTMHLFAISGLHIAVIATGIQFLLLLLRLPRIASILIGTLALWIYVQITGGTPSAMRAFVMVSILQTAFVLRLPTNGIATLAFAALATLLVAPMQLFSASFQMSYGIVAALLLYGLPLGERWQQQWSPFKDIPKVAWTRSQRAATIVQRYLLGVIGISIAASLVSAICGTIYFKLFTPGALLANLILIPAASLVILSGFISLLFGLIGLTPISILFNHASALVLLLMERSLESFTKIPGVATPAHFTPEWLGFLTLTLLLASMLFGYSQKWKLTRGGFWLPVAIVTAALILCVSFN